MTALAHSPTAALPANAASAQGSACATEVKDFAAAEALWRDLETAGTGSPYQRFDWQKAYVEAMAADGAFEPRVVQVRDGLGRVLLLLPLGIERQQGLRIGAPIGGKHANYHMPLVAHGAALPSPAELRALLREVGRALRLDAFVFANLPLSWHGIANPLAEGGRPSPSNGYRLSLSPDAEA